jgi:small subunit ribosomal protein S3Ae
MAERQEKKWRGKDWYDILAPDLFKNNKIGESPASSAKSILNRTIEVSVRELMNREKKYERSPGKITFKVNKVEGKNAYTIFHGYSIFRDFVFMAVRKRLQKVESVANYKTKDGWELQITMLVVLNRNVCKEVQRKVRLLIQSELDKFISSVKLDDLILSIINVQLQSKLRKSINKIYPARVCEVTKIEVLSTPKTK